MPARVAVTGSSGLIGTALKAALHERGDDVVAFVRRPATNPGEVEWDPARGTVSPGALDGVDAVVNLAGVGVGERRWTRSVRREILRSRVDSTRTLVSALVAQDRPIHLVSGSAVGFYGDRGDEIVTEATAPATTFLADVCRAWEGATAPASEAGHPVAHLRTGIVLAPEGGAMEPVLRLARLGLGGPLGSGRQFWPWITRADHVRAILHLLDHPEVTGPVNLVSPAPARQKDLAATLGEALHRPAVLPAPALAMRAVVGEFAGEVLASCRAVPERLLASGFAFEHATVPDAVDWLLRSA